MHWQIQEAKQRFSEVLRAAASGEPQFVTKHGAEVAVIVDIDSFHRLHGDSPSFMAYLRADAVADDDFAPERRRDQPRDVDLAG